MHSIITRCHLLPTHHKCCLLSKECCLQGGCAEGIAEWCWLEHTQWQYWVPSPQHYFTVFSSHSLGIGVTGIFCYYLSLLSKSISSILGLLFVGVKMKSAEIIEGGLTTAPGFLSERGQARGLDIHFHRQFPFMTSGLTLCLDTFSPKEKLSLLNIKLFCLMRQLNYWIELLVYRYWFQLLVNWNYQPQFQ